jgi:molecular chaperone GrpE
VTQDQEPKGANVERSQAQETENERQDLARLRRESDELKAQLEERDRQLQETIDRLKHLQADFENYKKRVAREREEFARLVEDRFLLKVLPIYDNMERAFRSYNHNNDKESFIEGMERIFAQMSDLLSSEGVRPIEALGGPFDPLLHEALLSVETDEEKPNIVLEEFERGYLRAERVLRPSRVKVSRKRPQASGETSGQSNPESYRDVKGGGTDGEREDRRH